MFILAVELSSLVYQQVRRPSTCCEIQFLTIFVEVTFQASTITRTVSKYQVEVLLWIHGVAGNFKFNVFVLFSADLTGAFQAFQAFQAQMISKNISGKFPIYAVLAPTLLCQISSFIVSIIS